MDLMGNALRLLIISIGFAKLAMFIGGKMNIFDKLIKLSGIKLKLKTTSKPKHMK